MIWEPAFARESGGHENYLYSSNKFIQLTNNKYMTKGNNILLAAIGGAILAALIAQYLTTERGRQFLESAVNTLKDFTGKATDYARNNLGEIVRETTSSLGPVVKEKIAQRVTKTSQPANPE
jgi:hypothetical protein